MDKNELLAHVELEEANCIVHYTSLLSEQRRKAMQYYYGQPYGNEVEGRSQVVTTEVKDAVEGILPALMAIFTASDEIVRFEPQRPEDEAEAQQATDYVNYVFSRLNNGFLALYCLFKDALLQKNGYVKVYWEQYQDPAKETYEDLSDNEFHSLLADKDLELVQHTAEEDTDAVEAMQQQVAQIQQQLPQMNPQQQQAAVMQIQALAQQPKPMKHDAVFRRVAKGKICVDPLPPEEVLVSRETPNELTKARFVEHRTLRTISEIREMGFDVEDSIADYAPNADFNLERVQRLSYDDALAYRQDSDTNDPSTRRVWLCEAYCYVDYDGDGIAELRKVTKVGKTLLDNEEFDSLPIIGGTAVLMPHKHYGLSIFDLVGDIQLIKSTVTRQLLDNAYNANNSRVVVLDGMVNMADLLTSRPGGVIRAKALNAVQQMNHQLLGQPFYNLLDYFDRMKTNRTGSRDFGDAIDPNALNAKAHTAEIVQNAAQERINLMARILAETCVKEIFWKILELEAKHNDKPRVVKLRGKWVQVDPREWKDKFHMTVTVGLGNGSQGAVVQGVQMLGNMMAGAVQMGLAGRVVSEQNVFNLIDTAAKAVFPKKSGMFATDPSTLPPPQPQPNVDLLKLHQKEGSDQRKVKLRYDQMQMQMMLKMKEMAQQNGIDLADLALNAAQLTHESAQSHRDRLHEHHQGERDRMVDLATSHMDRDHQASMAKERPTAQ